MGDPRLAQIARPVADPTAHGGLITDLFDTMRQLGGVGLAAPQIGVDLQVVVFHCEHSPRYPTAEPVPRTVLINPVLLPLDDQEEEGWEGCLSVPGLRALVPRWARLAYRGIAPDGSLIDRTVTGFHARVVQHECDHLNGRLYPSRIRDFQRFGFIGSLPPSYGLPLAE